MLYLIGDYQLLGAKSMNLYAKGIQDILREQKIKFKYLEPKIILNKINIKNFFLKKYFGYIDNYLLFGIYLFFTINKKDLVHICNQANSILYFFIRSKKIIITCHDLINIKLLFKKKIKLRTKIYQNLISYYLQKINIIICVSKNTQNELQKFLKINTNKTFVIYNLINQKFKKQKSNIIENDIKHLKYFIHVGNNNFYKNKTGLIKIFNNLIKFKKFKDFKLILVGSKINTNVSKLILKLNLKNKIINLINVNTEKLSYLYQNSMGLIFPSTEEGFGWPIIEAQYNGCLVITSNLPPMNEIGSSSSILINPKNFKTSAEVINKKFNSRKKMIKLGYKNVLRFNKDIFTKKILEIYQK